MAAEGCAPAWWLAGPPLDSVTSFCGSFALNATLKTQEKYHQQDVHVLHVPEMLVSQVGIAGWEKRRPEAPEFVPKSLLLQSPNSIRARSRNAQTWECKGRQM